jgi:sugar fermentation stimulation protein A
MSARAPSVTPPSVFYAFEEPRVDAIFLGRRKRFLADVRLESPLPEAVHDPTHPAGEAEASDGLETVAFCPNTGSMRGCLFPGAPAVLWDVNRPTRKLRTTLRAVKGPEAWVGVDTGIPNKLAALAIKGGVVPALSGFERVLSERKMGARSRVDLLLESGEGAETRRCWVEVKNVTLVEDGVARFPDAVTVRGLKHLRELSARVAEGDRAAMLYIIQRADGRRFEPAADIDPDYAEGLIAAVAAGVEAYALRTEVSALGVRTRELVPIKLPR